MAPLSRAGPPELHGWPQESHEDVFQPRLLPTRHDRSQKRAPTRVDLFRAAGEDGFEELFLALEMVVDQGGIDAGSFRDGPRGRAVEAAIGKDCLRSIENQIRCIAACTRHAGIRPGWRGFPQRAMQQPRPSCTPILVASSSYRAISWLSA